MTNQISFIWMQLFIFEGAPCVKDRGYLCMVNLAVKFNLFYLNIMFMSQLLP